MAEVELFRGEPGGFGGRAVGRRAEIPKASEASVTRTVQFDRSRWAYFLDVKTPGDIDARLPGWMDQAFE